MPRQQRSNNVLLLHIDESNFSRLFLDMNNVTHAKAVQPLLEWAATKAKMGLPAKLAQLSVEDVAGATAVLSPAKSAKDKQKNEKKAKKKKKKKDETQN